MARADAYGLRHGPYAMPPCQPSDVLVCEVHGPVAVHSISAGRIPWPRARASGRPPLIVCAGLAEAVRRESCRAVAYWWGVSTTTVGHWRRALGLPGRRRGQKGRPWTAAEDALLGTLPTAEVTRRTGRTPLAVYRRRFVLGIPSPQSPGRRGG
jgi:hypothetical protein